MRNVNGYGGIIKLSGKRRKPYAIRLTIGFKENGSQLFQYLGYYKTRREASNALALYNANPYDLDLAKMSFSRVFELWSAYGFDGLAASTIRSYKTGYKHSSTLYDIPFKDLKTSHLQQTIDSCEAISSKSSIKMLFSQLYKHALKHDIVDKDYSQYINLKKQESTNLHRPFSTRDLDILWDNKDNDTAQILLMLTYTGFRVSELLELKKENVFINERYVIGGKKTKAGTNRVVPINKKILPFFEKRIQQDVMFPSKTGVPLKYGNFMQFSFNPLMKELKMNHTIHDTRHTFISLMNNAGANPLSLKRIVGHSNNDITERYTHKTIEELIHEIDKI